MYELKDYLNAINYEPLMDTEDEQWEKISYIVNKCVAPFQDTIMLVNESTSFIIWTKTSV